MKKVAIKRISRAKPKLSTKAKVLAGLGLGTTLAGFGAGGATGKATNSKPMVRTQAQNKDSKTGKIKKLLTDTFGVPEAKGWYSATSGVNDGSAYNDPFYGSGGGNWNQGLGGDVSPTSFTAQTQTDINAATIYNNAASNALNNLADTAEAQAATQEATQDQTEQTGSGETETEGSALPTSGQTEGLGAGSGEAFASAFVPTWLDPNTIQTPVMEEPSIPVTSGVPVEPVSPTIQRGIEEMNETPPPVDPILTIDQGGSGEAGATVAGNYAPYTTSAVSNPVFATPDSKTTFVDINNSPIQATGIDASEFENILNASQSSLPNGEQGPVTAVPNNATLPSDINTPPPSFAGVDKNGNNIYFNDGQYQDNYGTVYESVLENGQWVFKQAEAPFINVTDTITPIEYSLATYDNKSARTDVPASSTSSKSSEVNNSNSLSNYMTTLGQQGVMTFLNTDGSYTLLDTTTGQTEARTLEQMVESSMAVGTSTQVTDGQVQNLSNQGLATANEQISSELTADLIRNYISQAPEATPEVVAPILTQASVATENTIIPSTPVMSDAELKTELAKYQSTPAEALASVQTSENNQTLNFTPLTLADGTKVTTTNGVNYTDAGGNFYFYNYEKGQDLLKYDAKAGEFVSVNITNPSGSQTQSVVSNITTTVTSLQEKANSGIKSGVGAIKNIFKGDDSGKADNLNLNPSKLKPMGKIAAIGGATMLAGPAGIMVAGVSSNSQAAWDKLVDWATNPENINRPGTVTWTNPTTKEKFSFSKQDVQSVLMVIQANDFKIHP